MTKDDYKIGDIYKFVGFFKITDIMKLDNGRYHYTILSDKVPELEIWAEVPEQKYGEVSSCVGFQGDFKLTNKNSNDISIVTFKLNNTKFPQSIFYIMSDGIEDIGHILKHKENE
ncbi:MAG: hypothetical protein OXB92_17370 [Acidimicrobiaceae bacterium]|nr:hypothetical protein [Acidimicrobiaceae bacterium]